MTQKILGIILLLALSQILWAHFAVSAEIVRKTTLSNGLTLVVVEQTSSPPSTCSSWCGPVPPRIALTSSG